MEDYLKDTEFLRKLDKMKIRTQFAKIILLDFAEKPIKEIQGTITNGTLNINGASACRRTINLTMLAKPENSSLTDLNNDIAINKKIRVEVGLRNPFKTYEKYGDIIWFKCGLFVISTASLSRATSGWSISLTAKDKMCLLDGSVGGMITATTNFHEIETLTSEGKIQYEYPTIYQIIFQAVLNWGHEDAGKIFINDLQETAKMLVKYMGSNPIYFNDSYSSFNYSKEDEGGYIHECVQGQDIGYRVTDFTYPGELILKAGDSVVTLLSKICETLSNFEYFYDIDGNFHFQEKKNYLNTSSPLLELKPEDYFSTYANQKVSYSFTDMESISSISVAPKYENIKNDFVVWGKRTLDSGIEVEIHYHLTIAAKPTNFDNTTQYMYKITDADGLILSYKFYPKKINVKDANYTIKNDKGENIKITQEEKILYDTWNGASIEIKEHYDNKKENAKLKCTLIGVPILEKQENYTVMIWREELYRRVLMSSSQGQSYLGTEYDMELLGFWRDICKMNNVKDEMYLDISDVRSLPFWFDFIDTSAGYGAYSIDAIGRRTKAVNDDKINSLYNEDVPDVIFLTEEEMSNTNLLKYYNDIGQSYFQISDNFEKQFVTSSTGSSAFDKIRELLYQYLVYNTQITLQGSPIYYLEPNTLIYIEDKDSGVKGRYEISSISIPLAYSGNMSITATEALSRV